MANPPRPSTSSKWKLRSQNTPVDHSPIHIPPTDTSAVQRPKVLATVRDSNPAGLTGVTSQGTNPTQFSQPRVAPQPAQVTTGQDPVSPAKRTRKRKIAPDKAGQSKPSDTAAADNERRVKARIAPTDDPRAATQTTTGNPFVAAIESEARESESGVDVVDIFFHGVRTLANDLSRAAQKGRDVTKMLEAIKSELNGAHLPLKVSEIGDGCMRRDRKALVSNLKHGLKPIVYRACDTTPRPERLTHEQLLDMCRPQAPLRAPTPVFTTTTTVTTLANTTATAAVDTAVAGFDDDTWLPDEFR